MKVHVFGTIKTGENINTYNCLGEYNSKNSVLKYLDNEKITTFIYFSKKLIIRDSEEYQIILNLEDSSLKTTLKKQQLSNVLKLKCINTNIIKNNFYTEYTIDKDLIIFKLKYEEVL